jgi:DNA polymerase III alpha subunit
MHKRPVDPDSFAHLHVHSEFSLLSGVPRIADLVAKAKAMGMSALALTDTNRMSGLILFYKECLAAGILPILGVELNEVARPKETLVLLAKNDEGYGDICELTTLRQRDGAAFSFAKAFAKEWPNLFLLTASPRCLKILAVSPNRPHLFGELLRHFPESRACSRELEDLCLSEGIPMAATGACRFLEHKDYELHRILRAIDLNSTLSRLKPEETAPEGAWLRSHEQMMEICADRPDAMANAAGIALRCHAQPPMGKWIMPEIAVPKGYTPDTYLSRVAAEGLWKKYGNKPEFAKARIIQEMELQVIRKLGYSSYFLMVKEMRDWAGRSLRSSFRRGRDCSILRGSGANSITFFNLGVCNLDPVAHNLYFQRFLNEDRAAPPDADLDFGWDERDRALKWMVERFGRDRVAITCTTNCFRGRAAFREAAKVFGYSDEQVSSVLDSFQTKGRRLDDDTIRSIQAWASKLQGKPRFIGQHPGGLIITNQPIWRHVACEWSRIASGDSLGVGGANSRRNGGDSLGVCSANSTGARMDNGGARRGFGENDSGRLVTQVDMHNGIDELGLIKFDLLGNGSISVLRDTLGQLEEQGQPDPEVWDIEKCLRDPKVRDMLVEGKTRGIFYIESPAQIRLNQRAKVESFAEVVITSSLIRPAGTGYCKLFVERHRMLKDNVKDWEFLHPDLEGILGDTHDVCAFQEDVIRICHDIAGLSFKLADRIRKMMNSQHEGAPARSEWERTRLLFIQGCKENPKLSHPLSQAQAEELWERVASFAGFSFCKSHSASYAELSFQCAHLKSRFPSQFLSAVISNRHGFYTRDVYLDEARRWGLRILPIDVNTSRLEFHGRDNWIRPGLMPVRGCREAALKVLVQERNDNGPYRDLPDLLQRVPLHKREVENLILAGACDSFGENQPELLYLLDAAYGKSGAVASPVAQSDLFGSAGADQGVNWTPKSLTIVNLKIASRVGDGDVATASGWARVGLGDYSLMQKCLNELRMLGYVLSANMLEVVATHSAARDAVRADSLRHHVGKRVKVLGIPVTDRLHPVASSANEDRNGRYMKFLTMADNTGYLDVIFWPDALEKWGDELAGQAQFSGNLLEIWGKVSEEWGTYSVEADSVRIVEWLPNQVDFEMASRRLREGLKNYPAYAQDLGSLAA